MTKDNRRTDSGDSSDTFFRHFPAAMNNDVRIVGGGAGTYQAPAVAQFCLNFFARDWFGAGLKGADAITFAHLVMSIYICQSQGLLMSKKDAMRTIGAEHIATLNRFLEVATNLKILEIKKADAIDSRIHLLVPTQEGIAKIEQELNTIVRTVNWMKARLDGDWSGVSENSDSITTELPRIEDLTLVADPLASRHLKPAPNLPARTVARYHAAYAQTASLMKDNIEGLTNSARFLRWSGQPEAFKKALVLINEAERRQPNSQLLLRPMIEIPLGNFDSAIADISKFYELWPSADPVPKFARAQAYIGKKEFALALDDIDALINWCPNPVASSHCLRGVALAGLGRYREALATLEKAKIIAGEEHTQDVTNEFVVTNPSLKDVLDIASSDTDYDPTSAHIQQIITAIKTEMRKQK